MSNLFRHIIVLGLFGMASAVEAAPQSAPVIDVVPVPNKETIGDWTVTFLGNGAAIATTANSANATFGAVCDKTGYQGFFNPQTKCDAGDKYPGLINAPSSAFSIMMTCEKIDDFWVLNLPLEGSVNDAMSVGGVLGFAFPMASGEFKVARFSLTGAARAVARAQQYASGYSPERKVQTHDNYSL